MVDISVHVVLGPIYTQDIYVTTAGTQILWDNFLTASHTSYLTLAIERGFFSVCFLVDIFRNKSLFTAT